MWYTPAERNRFTGEPITRTIRVRKMTIDEETAAIGIVILIKVAAMTIEDNVTVVVVTEIEVEIVGIGTMISAKRPSDRLKMKKMTTERGAIKIIIIGTIAGIVIAIGTTGIDVEIVATAVNGTGDTLGTTGRKIDTGTIVQAIIKRGIVRDQDHDQEIARHRCHSGR